MRVIFDTNVLLSALLSAKSPPAQLLGHWRQGRFTLLSCEEQLDEVRRVTRYPKIRERLAPALAGRLVNEVRALSDMIDNLPIVDVSPDPWDDYRNYPPPSQCVAGVIHTVDESRGTRAAYEA